MVAESVTVKGYKSTYIRYKQIFLFKINLSTVFELISAKVNIPYGFIYLSSGLNKCGLSIKPYNM